jgi:hypothetical protein
MIDAALEYLNQGYCVIPIRKDKKPYLMSWLEYQEKLSTIDSVKKWWSTWPDANIGIVTGKISNICVVDVDSNAAGHEIKKLLPDISPTVKTPGGGWHFYFENSNGMGNAIGIIKDVDFRGQGGYIIAPPSIGENGNAYELYGDNDINRDIALPESIINLLNNNISIYTNNCKDRANDGVASCLPMSTDVYFSKGHRDNALFHLANHLVKSKMPVDNIHRYLHFFASNCDPPFTPKETELKIKSALKRSDIREKSLSDEIREYVLSTNGHWMSTDIYSCLLLSTRNEKKLCSKVLSEMVSEGIIERYGNKNGVFRRIEKSAPDIDIFAEREKPLDIKFPLNLHEYFNAKPKNICLIAGTQDAGKTGFFLRFVAMNMNKGHEIRYQSSEMGSDELISRLELFENIPLSDWKNVNFKESSSNFHDRILPNGINIIDYLEVTKEFWLVAEELKKIYDKLDKGIVLVGLQKDFKTELGRGGSFSLEKPRLYVTLTSNPPEGGIAKIVKCKNWVHPRINPNGRTCHFKLRNGCEIRQLTEWNYDKPTKLPKDE